MTSPKDIFIGNITIGHNHPPFVIAEMSGNHNGSLDYAMDIVEAAAQAGVSALKLQTYTADTMTLPLKTGEFFIDDPQSLWQGHSLYELYEQASTPWQWHEPIFKRCKELGILAFSTPFDASAVAFLESLDVPAYKISSFEITDIPLIQKVAHTGKPLILSTGMASLEEIDEAVTAAKTAGCNDIILLRCSSLYPAPPNTIHLRMIPQLQERFGLQIGLSDHTLGIGVAVASVALGATVIEKHFTLRRDDKGIDAAFSLEPDEMAALVRECRNAWEALGSSNYELTDREKMAKIHRRSLYVTQDLKKGDALRPNNIRAIRPGKGLSPKYYDQLIGRTVNRDISVGTPIQWDLLQ